ncbi:aldose 1-epimerase family protein [Swingsia samuiensis]|uniref:Aldose 1-epimerase family protein n=1 Tax=Swingsia samuiensis TaxID=1293412 RepID=A0A4Y6UIN7_9PROT|nr:aldose 1-epimerase family protein [Swingsia samuiensis]QDH17489.1 aldose 1-epimerase family protein [Swingsia samuiensis]
MSDTTHTFSHNGLTATVSSHGAELTALLAPDGRNILWEAGPEWPRHSPVLFPIVGKAPDNSTLDDLPVHLTQHGFARDMTFTWVERSPTGCILELKDTPQTHELFPSQFRLTLIYQIKEDALHVGYVLTNPSDHKILHTSLGAHPAFKWPQYPGDTKENYQLIFEKNEPDPIHRISPKGLLPDDFHSPIAGRILKLNDQLFEADAIIMLNTKSHSIDFTNPDGLGLRIRWEGFQDLGIWTKPGAEFLCIEPWYGYATPEGFSGDFSKKPELLHLNPHESWEASWSVKPLS